MSVTAQRLAEAMADAGIDQTALAREIKVTQGTISLICLGKTQRSKHLPAIANFLGVSLTWLAGLDDLKYPGPDQVMLRPHEKDALEKLRMLNPIDQPIVRAVLDAMIIRAAISIEHVVLVPTAKGLPQKAPLVEMFKGLLQSVDLSTPLDDLAHELAELLPIALSQIRGPLFEHPTAAGEAARIALEAAASDNRELQP